MAPAAMAITNPTEVDETGGTGRRRFLTATASVIGAVGIGIAAVPFVKSWLPSAATRAAGAPVVLDTSLIAAGQMVVVAWRGKPVFVLRRTAQMLATLEQGTTLEMLRDPGSELASQQPSYAQNSFRSIRDELFIVVGVCTHLGCVPKFFPDSNARQLGNEWPGGFFCPCHNSKFDLAGRVFRGVPAPSNLVVPPYYFLDESVVVIGEDQAAT